MDANFEMLDYKLEEIKIELGQSQSKPAQKIKSYEIENVESQIMKIVQENQYKEVQGNPILINITLELEELLEQFNQDIQSKHQEEILKIRMHQLAISKLLVFTHAKSDFRLVIAHFNIGRAYLNYRCYEQARDHLTVAIKKNAKMTEIRETKLYHSFIMTTLSRCFYDLGSFEDSLEILTRAYEIQQTFQTIQKKNYMSKETIQLISLSYLKLQNFRSSLDYIDKILDPIQVSLKDTQICRQRLEKCSKKLQQKYLIENTKGIFAEFNQNNSTTPKQRKKQLNQQKNKINLNIEKDKLLQELQRFLERIDDYVLEMDKKQMKSKIINYKKQINQLFQTNLKQIIQILQEILLELRDIEKKLQRQIYKKLINKSIIHGEEGNIQNAIEQIKCIQQLFEKSECNATEQNKMEVFLYLIDYYEKYGDYDTKFNYLLKVEEMCEKSPTLEIQPNLLKIKRNLSMMLFQRHQPKNAIIKLEQIEALQIKLFGKNCPEAQKTKTMIGIAHLNFNSEQEAEKILENQKSPHNLNSKSRKSAIVSKRNSSFISKNTSKQTSKLILLPNYF